jgi:hypothetical protein
MINLWQDLRYAVRQLRKDGLAVFWLLFDERHSGGKSHQPAGVSSVAGRAGGAGATAFGRGDLRASVEPGGGTWTDAYCCAGITESVVWGTCV